MKNIFKIFTLLFFSFFISSCANGLIGGDIGGSSEEYDGVTIIVKSQDNSINFASGSSSRTIMSATVSHQNLYFYLWGKNRITNETVNVTKVTLNPGSDSTTGTINIDQLSSSNYELYLGATKEYVETASVENSTALSQIKSKLWFVGLANADLRYTSKVVFYLSPHTVTGYGSVALKLYFPWFDATQYPSYNITAALYDLNTDEVVRQQYIAENGAINPYSTVSPEITTTVPVNPNYEAIKILPGYYNFKVIFENTSINKKYIWSDIIEVLANRETSRVIEIPNILLSSYIEPPANFAAFYSTPSSTDSEYYPVEFCWDDNSNNEFYFQLELIDLSKYEYSSLNSSDDGYDSYVATLLNSSTTLSAKNAAWEHLEDYVGSNVFTPDSYGDSSIDAWKDYCSSGSLLSNSKYVVYNFMLGTRYIARICAKNEVGSSTYAYVDLTNACARSRVSFSGEGSFNSWAAGSMAINLYKIEYNTNGGNFYDDTTPTTIVNSVPMCVYSNQKSGTPYSLLNPISYEYTSGKNATLKTGSGTVWTSWKTQIASDVTYNSSNLAYSDFKCLNLIADYDGQATSSTVTLNVNEEILIYGGLTTDVNGVQIIGNLPDFTIDEETCQLSASVNRAQYQRLWFYIYNQTLNANTSVRKFSNISVSTVDRYGRPVDCPENRVNYDVEYPHFCIDLSDSEAYPAGLYHATITLTPTESPTNKIYVTFLFHVTD